LPCQVSPRRRTHSHATDMVFHMKTTLNIDDTSWTVSGGKQADKLRPCPSSWNRRYGCFFNPAVASRSEDFDPSRLSEVEATSSISLIAMPCTTLWKGAAKCLLSIQTCLLYAANQDSEFHERCRRAIEQCLTRASPGRYGQ
jgi:hypothetical protein